MKAVLRALHVLVALSATQGRAQEPDSLATLSRLLEEPVISASRQERRVSETPAVITVISGREMRRRGFRSVAEALASLPGLYAIDDQLDVDIGIRGFRGGMRQANRILKVLVDDQPVAFRPNGSVSLGPDFIPIGAIERIEVLRGPASALYGANAYLGVVHIITRRPEGDLQGLATLRAGRERGGIGSSVESTLLGGDGVLGGLVSAGLGQEDRSGHAIPAASPVLHTIGVARQSSDQALSRPVTLYLKGRWTPDATWTHEASFQGSLQRTVAEWLDFGTLSHENRIGQRVLTGGLRTLWTPSSTLRFRAQVGLSDGRPYDEALSTGSTTVRPRRELWTRGLDAALEAQWEARPGTWVVGGLDRSQDRHQLMGLYSVSRSTGVEQRVFPEQGIRTFMNTGAYLQVGLHPFRDAELTLNLRQDDHNLTGIVRTWRAGLVMKATESLRVKLLAGTSFKAPSALQLFAVPIFPGDLVGNPALRPERARTLEVCTDLELGGGLRLRNSLFHTRIVDFIDLAPYNTNQRPVNRGISTSTGLENEVVWVSGGLELAAALTLLEARVQRQEPLKPDGWIPTSGFPRVSGQVRATQVLPVGGSLELAVRHASSRRATDSSIFENHFTAYALAPVTLLDAGWTLPLEGATLRLQVRNLLDRMWSEPGSRGYDLPGGRREWTLSLSTRF